MILKLKQKLIIWLWALLIILWGTLIVSNFVEAATPVYKTDYTSHMKEYVIQPDTVWADNGKTLRQKITNMLYPRGSDTSKIYEVVRDMTLWIMILFFVRAWASLLLNKKPEESKKHLYSLLYIVLWWVLVYGANRLFWSVFNFNTQFTEWTEWLKWFTDSLIWKVAFVILSAIKAAAFFIAIIMTVVTWFKVIAAWEWEKWKKLVKWLINVVVALLVIKWIDFIYYLAADSDNFIDNASNLIINIAKVFGYLYWIVTVIMVIIAWYLYITDGWNWANFKKATNVIINILLSALVLFWFLLIVYQIFAEFQTKGDAVTSPEASNPTAYLITDKNYV
jgi:hypothetical protein